MFNKIIGNIINNMTDDMTSNMIRHKKRILDFIKKNKVVTSYEVAKYIGVSWNTADSWLKDLALENELMRIKKKGGLNLWMKK